MVEIIDLDTFSREKIKDVLCRHGFNFIDAKTDDDQYLDPKTNVSFFISCMKDHAEFMAANKVPDGTDASNIYQVLNLLNSRFLGKYSFEMSDDGGFLFLTYRFRILPDPLGFHAGWFAASVRRICESHKKVLEIFLTLLSQKYED